MKANDSQSTNNPDVPNLGTNVPRLGMMQTSSPLADALFGKGRALVLALFFGHPGEWFYTRQVIDALQMGQGAVQREIKQFSDTGILQRERRGREVYYRANPHCPIYKELFGLMQKTLGLVDVLRSAFSPLADRIDVAFVYGSMAKGSANGLSDVDVMVIGAVSSSEVLSALSPTQDILGREVNTSLYAAQEVRDRLARHDHFVTQVFAGPKLFLIGEEDDLERLAFRGKSEASSDESA